MSGFIWFMDLKNNLTSVGYKVIEFGNVKSPLIYKIELQKIAI